MGNRKSVAIAVVGVVVVAGISFLALRALRGKRGHESRAEATRQVREEPVASASGQVVPGQTIGFLRNGVIWLVRPDGSGKTRLTSSDKIVSFCYSPDGRKVAFVRSDELWVMDADGRGAKVLVQDKSIHWYTGQGGYRTRDPVAWTADSARLIFATQEELGGSAAVWSIGPDGRGERKLADLPEGSVPGPFSPDGRYHLYLKSAVTEARDPQDPVNYLSAESLHVLDLTGGKARKIAQQTVSRDPDPGAMDNAGARGFDACFSPDSRQIAYGTAPGFVWNQVASVSIAPTAGGSARLLNDERHPRGCWDFVWSPTGEKLIGVYDEGFVVVNVATNGWTYLHADVAPGEELGAMTPVAEGGGWAVSPDGRRIAFVVSSGPDYACKIKVMNVDGLDRRTIADLDLVSYIRWVPIGGEVAIGRRETNAPLHKAASAGQTDSVELWLAKGADVNSIDSKGVTPLHKAAAKGHTEVVKLLLAKGAAVNAKTGEHGLTPLHFAAARGHTAAAQLLLGRGAEVNAADASGWTPLHMAAAEGHTGTVELLLAKGAKVNAREEDGVTALHAAAVNGHADTATALVANGADVNAIARDESTPLHFAASKGHTAMVRLLLSQRARVNARDEDGSTPLSLASKNGYREVAKLLRESGGKE